MFIHIKKKQNVINLLSRRDQIKKKIELNIKNFIGRMLFNRPDRVFEKLQVP